MFDYLIIGAGFAGRVLAEGLARTGNEQVLIADKRAHIGGNAYDCHDSARIIFHHYGPQIFKPIRQKFLITFYTSPIEGNISTECVLGLYVGSDPD